MKCTGCALCAPLHIIWHEQEIKRGERERVGGRRRLGGGEGVCLGERNTIFYTEKDSCVCVCVCVCVCSRHWEEDWISSSMLKSIRYSVDYISVLLKQTRYFELSC